MKLKIFYERIKKNKFFFGSISIISGTVIVQLVAILLSPLITRIYSPEQFGIYAIFAAILSTTILVTSFRYELALLIPKEITDSKILLYVSIFILIIFCTLIYSIISLNMELIQNYYNYINNEIVIIFFLALFFGSLNKIFNYWMYRFQDLSGVTIYAVIYGIGLLFFQIFYMILFEDNIGLIRAHFTALFVGLLFLLKRNFFSIKKDFTIKWIKIKSLLFRFKRFPIYSVWADLLNSIYLNSVIIFLSYNFSLLLAGQYYFALKISSAPVKIMSEGIGKSFMSNSLDEFKKNNLKPFTSKILKFLISISLGPFVIFFLVAPDLFLFVFGESWGYAGTIAQFISINMFFVFVFVPMLTLLTILEFQNVDMIFQSFLVGVSVLSIIIGFSNFELFMFTYYIFSSLIYFIFGCWILNKIGITFTYVLKYITKEFFKFIPLILIFYLLNNFKNSLMISIQLHNFLIFSLFGLYIFYTFKKSQNEFIKFYKN